MKGHAVISSALLGALVLFPGIAMTAEPAAPAAPSEEGAVGEVKQADLDALNERLRSLEDKVQKLLDALQPAEPPAEEKEAPNAVRKIPAPESSEAADTAKQQEMEVLWELVTDHDARLADLVSEISRGGQGGYMLAVRNLMQKEQFREDLSGAIHELIRQRGTLRVDNKSGVSHQMRVNGRIYPIPAGRAVDIEVPVGTVTSELIGYERAKNWMVGPPNYFQSITITPTAAPAPVASYVYDPWTGVYYLAE
ncbi:MAG: hypothetical protein ACYTG0_08010 [Planctomycetota bacterium]|jgi:hypothetical protein